MARVGWAGWTGVAASLLVLAPAGADDTAVMKEIEALKAKIQELERKAADRPVTPGVVPVAAPSQAAVKDPMPTPAAPAGPGAGDAAGGALEWVKDIKVYGFVDVAATANINSPDNHTNVLRGFDHRSNSFTVHNTQLDIERVATMDSIVGFKAEFSLGEDAEIINSASFLPSATTPAAAADGADIFDVQEAYVQFIAPVGDGLDIRVGKMATLAGYEVIESKDNYNYSRSLLFTWAIPFTHTGIRASYQVFPEWLKLTLGVNNGWDQVEDVNDGKTWEFQFALTPVIDGKQWLAFYGNFYYGSERGTDIPTAFVPTTITEGSEGDRRFLMDLVMILTPVENWTFGLNFDMGSDEDAIHIAGNAEPQNAKWRGLAGYVKYQMWDWYAISVRGETFTDQDGFRLGGGGIVDQAPAAKPTLLGRDQQVWEVTLTQEFKIAERVLVRLEFRHDSAEDEIFLHQSEADDTQDTLACELIFPF